MLIKRMPHSIWPRNQRRVAMLVTGAVVGNECPRATADRYHGAELAHDLQIENWGITTKAGIRCKVINDG